MKTIARNRLTTLFLLVATMLSPGLHGCSTNPATGEQSFTAFLSPEQESRVGREQDPHLKKAFGGVYDDPELAAYVARIGKKLAATSEMPDLDFTFTVLNSPVVNAFALPGGYVYVTRGLIALAENEAELAAVIAHEIGHITARHSAERYSRGAAINLGAILLGALTNSEAVFDLAGLGSQLYLKSYSREQEIQADSLGVRYLARAGYETGAMASFLKKLGNAARLQAEIAGARRDPDVIDLMSTHPRTTERVQRALAAAKGQQVANPVIGRDPFLDQVDGVLFGSDPKHGMVRDRVFLHRGLDFRFEVPPGFRIFNQPERILARNQNGAQFIFDKAPTSSGPSPASYIETFWAKENAVYDLENIAVNGMEAATGWLPITANDGGSYILRLVAVRYDAETIYRMQFLIPSHVVRPMSEAMRRTTYSFRRLSVEESTSIGAYRVNVLRYGGSATERSISRAIPFPGYEVRYFRMINGLENGALLPNGLRVKTINRD